MKLRWILFAGLLIAGCKSVEAAEPMFWVPSPESNYTVTQATIAMSSSTVSTIAATTRYRKVELGDLASATTIFYRIDGSTQSIPTVGWQIWPGTTDTIECNSTISMQLGVGASSMTVRYIEYTK